MSRTRPLTSMRCGLTRLVPRIVPPTVRMPDNDVLIERHHPVFDQPEKTVADANRLDTATEHALCQRRELPRSSRGSRRRP